MVALMFIILTTIMMDWANYDLFTILDVVKQVKSIFLVVGQLNLTERGFSLEKCSSFGYW